MTSAQERDGRREAQRKKDLENLRMIEQAAVQRGTKLGPRDRLKAAFHLTRAWAQAKAAGLRKEEFQDTILPRIKRGHKSREAFRLNNWILRRGEDPTLQPDLVDIYADSPTPQKALEPYLIGISVAATHCGVEPDDWKLAMVHDLSIWARPALSPGIAPPDDRPAETLEILLRALCASLGKKNRLDETFNAIGAMSCRWDCFSEQLIPSDDCMEFDDFMLTPLGNHDIAVAEMFPFPSVPLLYVPYFVADAEFVISPETEPYAGEGSGPAANDAPKFQTENGRLVRFREVRLCIVPDGKGGYASALEHRPYVEVGFPMRSPVGGEHRLQIGYRLDLEDEFFNWSGDGGPKWQQIRTSSGETWRITLSKRPDGSIAIVKSTTRLAGSDGWDFDPDPVLRPGEFFVSSYLSCSPASALYLRHWLTSDFRLGEVPERCPWSYFNHDWDDPEGCWRRNLPPGYELNFPRNNYAHSIECCLHNGLIEEALQASIDRLKEQTALRQAEWHVAREAHANVLLRRWQAGSDKTEIDQ